VRDDVDCGEAALFGERHRHLTRGRTGRVEQDRLDLWAQMAEEGGDVGNPGIDEQDLPGACRG